MYENAYQPPTQFSVFPPVLKNLLILNGLVFFAQMVPVTNELLMQWFALWPLGTPDFVRTPYGLQRVSDFFPWQLITYGFLHGGFSHILFNMFALWMFGVQIENAWGSRRFAIFYFVCVIGAGLVQLVFASLTGGVYPTVGASGGVYGILLAFGMMFPDQPIYLYFIFPIKAKYLVIGFGLLSLLGGFGGSIMPEVAHFAHLGGMFFGFLLILYWQGKLPVKPEQRMYW